VDLLREAARPRKIILFGSYATGSPDDGSDVDFLVVEPGRPDIMAETVRLLRVLGPLRIPADVIVVGATDFDEWSDIPGNVVFEAASAGKVLYEAA
jgi:predicted nucleotidyltransferase